MAPESIEVKVKLPPLPELAAEMVAKMDSVQQGKFFGMLMSVMDGQYGGRGKTVMQLAAARDAIASSGDARELIEHLAPVGGYTTATVMIRPFIDEGSDFDLSSVGGYKIKPKLVGTVDIAADQAILDKLAEARRQGFDGICTDDGSARDSELPECPDCKGSGKYQGFTAVEDCRACDGTGRST